MFLNAVDSPLYRNVSAQGKLIVSRITDLCMGQVWTGATVSATTTLESRGLKPSHKEVWEGQQLPCRAEKDGMKGGSPQNGDGRSSGYSGFVLRGITFTLLTWFLQYPA